MLLVSGCSAVRVGYNQAPTLAWWWLDGYMDFNADQAPRVKDALSQWFAWHRTTQLPDYANLLAAAQVQVLQPATPAQVCRWSDELRARIGVAFAQGVPMAADLLPSLTPQQLTHLERKYRKSNQEFEEDFLQQQADERLKASVTRAIDRTEMLYGTLDERQRQLVAAGVAASPFDPALWFAERQAVQRETLQTLARLSAGGPARADRESNLAGLQALSARAQRSTDRGQLPDLPAAADGVQLCVLRAGAQQHHVCATAGGKDQAQGMGRGLARVGGAARAERRQGLVKAGAPQ